MFFSQFTGLPQQHDAPQTQTWKQQQPIYIFHLRHVQGLLRTIKEMWVYICLFAYSDLMLFDDVEISKY